MSRVETALRLAKKGFRLFPLQPDGKIPAIKDFSHKATTDEAQIKKWFSKHDFNIGISTDEFLVVDVDNKSEDKNGLQTIEKLKAEGKIFPPTCTQFTATGGLHLIYRVDKPVKNSVSKLGPGLDIRGKGGYIVAAGSAIKGVPYKMNNRAYDDAPEWLRESCTYDVDEPARAKEVAADVDPDKAWERGKQFLEALAPAHAGARNQEAYKVATRLKDIGVQPTDAPQLMLEHWKCEPMLEIHELKHVVNSAYKYGKEPQGSASPEAEFEKVEEPAKKDEGHPIENLNKHYAFLLLEGKHRILYETTDSAGNFKLQLLEETTFHQSLASRTHTFADGKSVNLTKFWIKHPDRREYDGLVFRPECKVDPRFYNLWRGYSVTELAPDEKPTLEMERAVRAFEEHIFENVCKMDGDYYAWVMNWFAHMIQKPWEKPKTALVLRGKKGVGKNMVFEAFQPMFPSHYLVSGDRRYLTSNFNAHLERLLLFVADEAFWSGDKASEGILKSLITDERISIEKKGKDPATIESCHRVAILGNDEWVVPASHDERRYAIFDMGNGRKQDRKFFGQMDRDMKAGGTRYLFTKMKNMELTVDIGQIPITEGLLEQKKRTLSLEKQWWLDSLVQGYIENISEFEETGAWATDVDRNSFKNAYRIYAKNRGASKWLCDDSAFLKMIAEFCPSVKVVKQDSKLPRITLPPLDVARQEWDEYMGHADKWA